MQNDPKVEAVVNAAKGRKVAILRGGGEAGERQSEKMKAALDKAGIESEIVDGPSFKLPTSGTLRILEDDSTPKYWVDKPPFETVTLPLDAPVREVIGWPVVAVPSGRSARLQKKRPRTSEVRTLHMCARHHKAIIAAAAIAAESASAKRAAWLARYKVPTRRKHGR